jgi:hypothetical protein
MAAMTEREPIRLFVTHAWEDSPDYLRAFEFLESARGFYYKNLSRPDQMPPDGNLDTQKEILRSQIREAEIVIAIGSLEAKHRDLLLFEMTFGQGTNKPVLLLPGFGSQVAPSAAIRDMSTETGTWDERAMVDAIRRLARGEQTGRWDVIEFKLD